MLIPSRGGISKLFCSICTPLIDISSSDKRRSAADSGSIVFVPAADYARRGKTKQLDHAPYRRSGVLDRYLSGKTYQALPESAVELSVFSHQCSILSRH